MRAIALSLMVASAAGVIAAVAPTKAHAEFLVGLAGANEFLGVNLEYAGAASSAYVVLGAYQAKTGYEVENLTGYLGYRRYQGGNFNSNTYFGGVFVGDVAGGATYTRIGAGGELGYQWVTENLRISTQIGLAIVGDPSGTGTPAVVNNEPRPQVLIGASISLR